MSVPIGCGLIALQYFFAFLFDIDSGEAEEFAKKLEELKIEQNDFIKSRELRSATIKILQSLTSQKVQTKRDLMRAIYFNEYIPSSKREEFELERYVSVADRISIPCLEYLISVRKVLIPFREQGIGSTLEGENHTYTETRDRKWWHDRSRKARPFGTFVQGWLSQNYGRQAPENIATQPDPNIDRVAWEKWMEKCQDEEDKQSAQYTEFAAECIELGIFRNQGSDYTISEFGEKFINMIPALAMSSGTELLI